jgi:hypothetical protein
MKFNGKGLYLVKAWPAPARIGNRDVPGSMIEHPALEESLTKSMVKIAMSYSPDHHHPKVQKIKK